MKNLISKILIIVLIFSTLSVSARNHKRIKGCAELVTKTMPLEAFHTIKTQQGIQVEITQKGGQQIEIEANENLMKYLSVRIDKGVLKAYLEEGSYSNIQIHIRVPFNPQIKSLVASSSGSIISRVTLSAPSILLRASSGASISASAKCENAQLTSSSCGRIHTVLHCKNTVQTNISSGSKVEGEIQCKVHNISASSSAQTYLKTTSEQSSIEASSGAKIDIEGKTENLHVSCCSSGATILAQHLQARHANLSASSGASIRSLCTELLNLEASSGAYIGYQGNATIGDIRVSSGAIVKKIEN